MTEVTRIDQMYARVLWRSRVGEALVRARAWELAIRNLRRGSATGARAKGGFIPDASFPHDA